MADLMFLLSIALAITAALGLLLAGFVWVPWLVGLVLMILLVILVRMTKSEAPVFSAVGQQKPAATNSPLQAAQQLAETSPSKTADASTEKPADLIMVYRGVKYKKGSESR